MPSIWVAAQLALNLTDAAEAARLSLLLGLQARSATSPSARSADRIANGEFDLAKRPDRADHLWADTIASSAVDQPNYAS